MGELRAKARQIPPPAHVCTTRTPTGTTRTFLARISILDCTQPQCAERATAARRYADANLDLVQRKIRDAEEAECTAREELFFWRIVAEAQRRQ